MPVALVIGERPQSQARHFCRSWRTVGAGGIEQHHHRNAECEQSNEPLRQ